MPHTMQEIPENIGARHKTWDPPPWQKKVYFLTSNTTLGSQQGNIGIKSLGLTPEGRK